MPEEKLKEPKKRIMDAAVRLFARQCYAATGVRELAHEADVNLAMINYYFGSKHKILESLIEEYFSSVEEIARRCFTGKAGPEEKLRRFIREAVDFMRKNRDLVFVSFSEIPYEMPEIAETKVRHMKNIQEIVLKELMPTLKSIIGRPFKVEIVVPAIAGLAILHFILSPVIEILVQQPLDDKFYDEYVEEITNLALYGLIGRTPGEGQQK